MLQRLGYWDDNRNSFPQHISADTIAKARGAKEKSPKGYNDEINSNRRSLHRKIQANRSQKAGHNSDFGNKSTTSRFVEQIADNYGSGGIMLDESCHCCSHEPSG